MNTRTIFATTLLCLLSGSAAFAEADLAALEKRVAALEAEVAKLKAEKNAASETVRDEADEDARLQSVAQEVRRRRAKRTGMDAARKPLGTFANEAGDSIRLLAQGKAEFVIGGDKRAATWRESNSVVTLTGPFANNDAPGELRFYFDAEKNLLWDGSKAEKRVSIYAKQTNEVQPASQPGARPAAGR